MSDPHIHNLKQRIKEAQKNGPLAQEKPPETDRGTMSQGFEAVFDVVATPIVCGGIGIGLDHFFTTSPVFFIIFAALGICAGFWNLHRASEKESENSSAIFPSKRLLNPEKKDKKAQILNEPEKSE